MKVATKQLIIHDCGYTVQIQYIGLLTVAVDEQHLQEIIALVHSTTA